MNAVYRVIDTLLPLEALQFDFMKNAFLAILLLTPLLGLLGTMAVNQQMAFFSDALGHSALTGIGLGIILGLRSDLAAMLIFGVIWAILITLIKQNGAASADTIISVFSSTSIALGLVILSRGGSFAKYSSLLIGDVLAVTDSDLLWLLLALIAGIGIWMLMYNRLLLTSIAVIFIMLSAFSGKLAIYLTPILPFMAYLMPKFGKITDGRAETLKKAALLVVAAILAVGGIGILAMSHATGRDLLAPMALRLAIVTPYIFCKTILAIAATLAAGSIAAIVVICRKGWVKGAIALGAAIYLAVFAAGVTIEPLNEWTAYEKVCREAQKASDSDTYNTLYVRRPENMDVYLGCDVCDWKEDIDGFAAGDHRGEVLIVPTELAISDTRLKEFLESREPVIAGEYSIYGL